ncbi:MAG: DUF2254 domain-containing protein [Deltaproteobacteria bacterium]|nr:DUF2254 domain-containing protein [Deltaproteobacteria bacterium]
MEQTKESVPTFVDAADEREASRRVWVKPLIMLAVGSVSLVILVVLIDFYVVGHYKGVTIGDIIVGAQATDAQQMVSGLAEVVAALLGIVITVASIIVQLAATRYTPRITEMYITDKTNLAFLAYFVVAAVYTMWITFSIRAGSATHYFVPTVGVFVLFVLLTVSILAMTPYFAYVFHFLNPQNVVARIRQQTISRSIKGSDQAGKVARNQINMLDGIEQLADVALNTLENKDKIIASRSVDALRDLATEYLRSKDGLSKGWFHISGSIRQDPDFVAMSDDHVAEMSDQRTWVEYKVLRQYQMIYNEALNRMRDLNYLIAIDTRYLGEVALAEHDDEALGLCLKFFNTYLRATLNARDVRTAYNVFNQYRGLVEQMIDAGIDDRVVEVGNYFRYYAQLAFTMKLSFVTETVAYDLGTLCERAYEANEAGNSTLDVLLEILLDVDKEPEAEEQETSLRGVRKAQIKLATYFLERGDEERARRIFDDMRDERPDRLRSIYEELHRIDSKDFWEIIDRGENFDYLDAERKKKLTEFFGWFPKRVMHPSDGEPSGTPS